MCVCVYITLSTAQYDEFCTGKGKQRNILKIISTHNQKTSSFSELPSKKNKIDFSKDLCPDFGSKKGAVGLTQS